MPKTSAVQQPTTISCEAKLFIINKRVILLLPREASDQLPSRGQTMVEGTLNGVTFKTPLEPDGTWRHWFTPDNSLLQAANIKAGDTVKLQLTPIKDWVEPEVPVDLQKAVAADHEVQQLWDAITPMARWEWVRWTRSTSNDETRQRRIKVACSKLKSGERRPCCWNRNLCTDPSVSKSGVLLEAD